MGGSSSWCMPLTRFTSWVLNLLPDTGKNPVRFGLIPLSGVYQPSRPLVPGSNNSCSGWMKRSIIVVIPYYMGYSGSWAVVRLTVRNTTMNSREKRLKTHFRVSDGEVHDCGYTVLYGA